LLGSSAADANTMKLNKRSISLNMESDASTTRASLPVRD
jgi:hypothetical protein